MFYLKDPIYAEQRRTVRLDELTNGSGGGQSGFVIAFAGKDPNNGNGDAEPKIKEKVKSLLEAKYGPGFDKAFEHAQTATGLLHPGRYLNLYKQLVKAEHTMKKDDSPLTFAEKGDSEGRLPEAEMKILKQVDLDRGTFQNLGSLASGGRRRKTRGRKTRTRKHNGRARKTRRRST
jgi:hypothetical protein